MGIKKVLVADDELIVRSLFSRIFSSHQVTLAENGSEACHKASEQKFDIAFIDVVMPVMDGIEAIREIKKIQPQLRIVVMTGFCIEDKVQDALRLGAEDCLYKPFTVSELQMVFEKAGRDEAVSQPAGI